MFEFSFVDVAGEVRLTDFLTCYDNGQFYELPVSALDLIALLRVGVHHSSALQARLNILKSTFRETAYLSYAEFGKFAFNYMVTGNGYLEAVRNRFGKVLSYRSRLSAYMRRSSDLSQFVYLRDLWRPLEIDNRNELIDAADVIHVMQDDLQQEIYGVPYYLAALNSIELNASATRFRRRYYDNGSHAGFILYNTDANMSEEDWAAMKKELKEAKGTGNFKNLFLRSPNGNTDNIKLIPIAEVAAKDEFLNIKGVSAEDMLAIHRVPPKLMGIVPKHAGSLGDAQTDARVFAANEVAPLQQQFLAINRQLGLPIFDFAEYHIGSDMSNSPS